jgi:hypothetical protein
MFSFIAVISLSDAVRIADSLLLRAEMESFNVLTERLSSISCAR